MPKKLIILVILSVLIFLFHVLKNIKHQKLNIENALIWILLSIGIIIGVLNLDILESLAHFLGIETLSNMTFFVGFIFLIFVIFNITRIISIQNKKIINLTQEIALLKKEVNKYAVKEKLNKNN